VTKKEIEKQAKLGEIYEQARSRLMLKKIKRRDEIKITF